MGMKESTENAAGFREAADRHLYTAEQLHGIAERVDELIDDASGADLARISIRQILIDLANAELTIARRLADSARGPA